MEQTLGKVAEKKAIDYYNKNIKGPLLRKEFGDELGNIIAKINFMITAIEYSTENLLKNPNVFAIITYDSEDTENLLKKEDSVIHINQWKIVLADKNIRYQPSYSSECNTSVYSRIYFSDELEKNKFDLKTGDLTDKEVFARIKTMACLTNIKIIKDFLQDELNNKNHL